VRPHQSLGTNVPDRRLPRAATALCCAALALPAAAEEDARDLGEALTKGTFSMSLRYRFEAVEDDGPTVADNTGLANADTHAYDTNKYWLWTSWGF
jgi:hypothetical protein